MPMPMKPLSKSRLMAYRQCPRRLWLELHRPELREDSAATQAIFRTGHQVGAIAQRLYDPDNTGTIIELSPERVADALAQTQALLGSAAPIFEAGFSASGARAFADVLLPVNAVDEPDAPTWRMVEVKASTQVKPYFRDDAAIQAHVARSAGVPLTAVALARIDSTWTYPGEGDYRGLLVEEDLTAEVFARGAEVQTWIDEAQAVARSADEPGTRAGRQCSEPYPCGFVAHCRRDEPEVAQPVHWLPQIRSTSLRAWIDAHPGASLGDVPDTLLSEIQRRVKAHTVSGEVYFDAEGAAADLEGHVFPACFVDFESINFGVPVWPGTRPFQQVPFQFSVHRLEACGTLSHRSFVDLSGDDPSRAFAHALIDACGSDGPVFVYNQAFEAARIRELAERFPGLSTALLALETRIVDLLKVARRRYYHPAQEGSWSIKRVLPAIAPDLNYATLDGVQDGGMAMDAYCEAIDPQTPAVRRAQIGEQLTAYCALDTYAMVRLWQFFAGRQDLGLCSAESVKEQ